MKKALELVDKTGEELHKILDSIKGVIEKANEVDEAPMTNDQSTLNEYADFVGEIISPCSNDIDELFVRLNEIEEDRGINMATLLTASIGMAAETGEFSEIVKKCSFQGKPLDADTEFHLQRELGDVIWYWAAACNALGVSPAKIVQMNIDKLMARFPDRQFSVHRSENRKEGDI